MEDFFSKPKEELAQTSEAIKEAMIRRGWKDAKIVYTNGTLIEATTPNGKRVRLCHIVSPVTSYSSVAIADDKYMTYCILQDLPGVRQPETVLLKAPNNPSKEQDAIKSLLKKHNKIVIKPLDGAHGNGVVTGINDLEKALATVEMIREKFGAKAVLAQEMLFCDKNEIRAVVINYQFVAAYERIPAMVTGDGKHTVLELIDEENSNFRTEPYVSKYAYINKDDAEKYLNSKDGNLKNSIPGVGEKVQVIPVSNQGQGGTNEYLPDIPEEKKKLAEEIAKKLQLPVIGIDFLGDYVIEVNAKPALRYPVDGKPATICVEKYLDYLESL